MSEPSGDVLYVRLRRVGPNQQKPSLYTIGNVTFDYNHEGWYEVARTFGEGLRRKRANELNRRSLPLFEVMTYEEVLNLERAELAAKQAEKEREQKLFAGERVSSAIPKDAMKARRVGSLLATERGPSPAPRQREEVSARRVEAPMEVERIQPAASADWEEEGAGEAKEAVTLMDKPAPVPTADKTPAPARRATPPRTADTGGRRLRQGGTSGKG